MTKRGKFLTIGLALLFCAALGWLLYRNSHDPLVTGQPLPLYVLNESAKEAIPLWPARKHRKWGYINRAGEFVIAPQFAAAHRFQEGLAGVELDGKISYIDKTGRIVIPSHIGDEFGFKSFSEGRAGFQDGVSRAPWQLFGIYPRKGYLDAHGNKVIEARFRGGGNFREGLAWVLQQLWFPRRYKFGYIDRNGKVVIGFEYDDARDFSEGFAPVRNGQKWFYIDRAGRPQFAKLLDFAYGFSEGLAAVKIEGRYGFIDKTGAWVVDPFYDAVERFSEGLAAVKISRQWGFIDHQGKMLIPLEYRFVREFAEGLAAVQIEGKWGFIDKTGKIVIPAQFAEAFSFQNGVARVEIETEERRRRDAYVDKTGKVFWQEE
jgi:bifunctional DNA-binding transcriptional regulator/antitoxin component of YhaV-PrlF toxin-antitoxin module